jgi:hypothetical protein
MKNLSIERMEKIEGGLECSDGFVELAAGSLSGLALLAVYTGPLGWGPALVLGAAGMYLGTQVCGAK